MSSRLDAVLKRFDDINRQDPRIIQYGGKEYPREYFHAVKLHEWILKLDPQASETLQLAARCNSIRRWEIPRDSYPRTTPGYHKWRKALQVFHAKVAEQILKEEGYGEAEIGKITALILMKNFPRDREAQLLEDADCLTFLETKFNAYIGEWDEAKTVRILKGTLSKMSPAAKATAAALPFSAAARALIQKALD